MHPIKQIPVQLWTFENESVIRIGRSTDNHVILYSAVVSRHHVELRRVGANWEAVNLGTNGTYLDGKRITQVPVSDGSIIRLARSGPNIKIRLGPEALKEDTAAMRANRTETQPRGENILIPTEVTDRKTGFPGLERGVPHEGASYSSISGIIPVPAHLQIDPEADSDEPADPISMIPSMDSGERPSSFPGFFDQDCPHLRGGDLFCVDCGQPLKVLDTLGKYQLLTVLGQSDLSITYQAWRAGRTVALKTLNEEWLKDPQVLASLEHEAETLRHLHHAHLPHLIEFFSEGKKPALVMQMMPGQNLRDYIAAHGPVTVERAIAWIFELCQILGYLHDFTPPVAHRDLRPQNIIYNPEQDTLALVDFGVIKRVILGRPMLPGSRGYFAPEQMQLHASPGTDLFALAPLLAFLITGHNPVVFYGDQEGQLRFRASLIPKLPKEMVPILHRLTEPTLENRYGSVEALEADLKTVPIKVRY
nr:MULTISPECIES: protein kinase [unclassified Leptolyngbya]